MTDQAAKDPVNRGRTLVATFAMGANGTIVFAILPIILGIAAAALGIGEAKLGVLSSAYYGGNLLTTVTSVFWVRRFDWRLLGLLGTIFLATGLILPTTVPSYEFYLGGLFLAGLGAGAIFALSMCVASDMVDPDRKFALKIGVESLYGAIILFTLPAFVLVKVGADGFMIALAVVIIGVGLLASGFPKGHTKRLEAVNNGQGENTGLVFLGLICLMLFFGAVVSVYVFLERIGQQNGADIATVGRFLAFSAVMGIVGPFLAAALGDRIGRIAPQVIGFAIVATCLALLSINPGVWGYGLAVAFIPGGWYFALAYQNGIIASADISGRYASLMAGAYAIGATFGPMAAGRFIEAFGYRALYLICGGLLVISIAGFRFIVRELKDNGAIS